MTDYKKDLYEHAKRLLKEKFEQGGTLSMEICFEEKPYLFSESENLFLQESISTGEKKEEKKAKAG